MNKGVFKEITEVKGNDTSSLYQVSDLGQVYSNRTKMFMKLQTDEQGYLRCFFSIKGKKFYGLVHRLVGFAFIPNPENKPFINHINGVKDDNRVENLEWCTRSENNKHAFDTGLVKNNYFCNNNPYKGKFGKEHNLSKPIYQYTLSGEFIREWESGSVAARELGLLCTGLCACARGKIQSSYGYVWKYN